MGRPALPEKLESIARGEKTYWTGQPCNLGFVADRLVDGSKCQCEAHKEKSAKNAKDRYLLDREARIAKAAIWTDENKERSLENKKRHYAKNKQAYLSKAAEWAGSNVDSRRKIAREYASRNPEKLLAQAHKGRACKLNATPPWFGELDEFVMLEAISVAKRRKEMTGIKWEVDHIIPLAGRKISGLHVAGNIQVIPQHYNRTKSNRYELGQPLPRG